MKRAFITGITGQDGSYLADFLLAKNYEVHGLIRRASTSNTSRLEHLYKDNENKQKNLYLHHGDLGDSPSLNKVISEIKPDEVYNLAAQSHVKISFEMPEYTSDITGLGTLRILEALKNAKLSETRFYQASSSELFGNTHIKPQNEETPFNPSSPYACAKLYAYHIVKNYRESYKFFACNGILFNHESPRRGDNFVTRKITKAVAMIKLGLQETLYLGNIDSKRDWGFAGDYVEAMWLMLQQPKPDDYVIATGKAFSVREFVEKAFKTLDIEIQWEGEGVNEKGLYKKTGKALIKINPEYFRPSEVDYLLGNTEKAEKILGWKPKTTFDELVKMMVFADYELLKNI